MVAGVRKEPPNLGDLLKKTRLRMATMAVEDALAVRRADARPIP
jgi:hypothetical protein